MAIPTAPNNAPPITNADFAANHQVVNPPRQVSLLPSAVSPVPVAVQIKGGTVGTSYSETITTSGGTSPYTYTLASGTLPAGTSLSSGGVISGTPTTAGTYTFDVMSTDSASHTGTQTFSITVSTPPPASNYGYTA